jgi:hypothetical protein
MKKYITAIIMISLFSLQCFGKNGMPEINGSTQSSSLTPKQLLSYIKDYQRDKSCPSDRIITEERNVSGMDVFGLSAGSTFMGFGFVCGITMGVACLGIPVVMGGMALVDKIHNEKTDDLYDKNGSPAIEACDGVNLDERGMDQATQAVWRKTCSDLGTLTNIYSEALHGADSPVTPNFSYPVQLNDSFLSWKAEDGKVIHNLSPLILLRDQMRSDRDEPNTICLSDKESSRSIRADLSLTLLEATDIITDQIMRY